MSFNKLTGCGNTLNFIKTHCKISQKTDEEVLIPQINVTLNQGQGHPNWYENVEFSGPYPYTKFERNQSVNVWIQANVNVLFTKSQK